MQIAGGKLTSKFLTESAVDDLGLGGGGTLHNKRKRAAPGDAAAPPARRGALTLTLAPQFRGATLRSAGADSGALGASSSAGQQLFTGLAFHVTGAISRGDEEEDADGEEAETWQDLLGTDELSKHTLERLIHARGGRFVQNAEGTFAVIADKRIARVQNLIAANSTTWLAVRGSFDRYVRTRFFRSRHLTCWAAHLRPLSNSTCILMSVQFIVQYRNTIVPVHYKCHFKIC